MSSSSNFDAGINVAVNDCLSLLGEVANPMLCFAPVFYADLHPKKQTGAQPWLYVQSKKKHMQ